MATFLYGMVTMGLLTAGLFFFQFWRRTADGLFLAFAAAFWLLALSQALGTVLQPVREEHSWIFLPRFAAFALLIVAIVRKNLERTRP